MSARPLIPIDDGKYTGRVGAKIRARRLRRKLTVTDAAELAGVAASTWSRWERAEALPIERLPLIADVLAIRVRDLIPSS